MIRGSFDLEIGPMKSGVRGLCSRSHAPQVSQQRQSPELLSTANTCIMSLPGCAPASPYYSLELSGTMILQSLAS